MLDLYDPVNWDTPLFPVAVAAQAALIAPATLRQWIVRRRVKLWEPEDDRPAGGVPAAGDGRAHTLSLRAVLHIAAAARLVAKGVDVSDAYGAAMHWAHVGEGHSRSTTPGRNPAGLFADPAWTFLVHYSGDEARVVRATPTDGALPFDYSDLFPTGYPVRGAPTIVFLNDVDRYARGVCEGYLRP